MPDMMSLEIYTQLGEEIDKFRQLIMWVTLIYLENGDFIENLQISYIITPAIIE